MEGAAREGAGVVAVGYYGLAVDEDVLDAGGVLAGAAPGGGGVDGCGVEDDDVGFHAVAEEATVRDAESECGEGGHFSNSLGEGDEFFAADVVGEEGGEGAVGPGTGEIAEEEAVGADHGEGVGHEVGEGGGVGARGNVGGLEVFVEEEIAEGVDLARGESVGYFGDGAAFEALVVGVFEVG